MDAVSASAGRLASTGGWTPGGFVSTLAGGGAIMAAVETVYEAAGGRDGLRRLAAAWHTRVMSDDEVSHAFSHGYRADHTERLAAYWAEALGGPADYSSSYGDETAVVRIHSGNGEHDEMDRRAIECFDQALADAGIDRRQRVGQVLHEYFAWATITAMARYHACADDVPGDLVIPKWSWNGLVGGPEAEAKGGNHAASPG